MSSTLSPTTLPSSLLGNDDIYGLSGVSDVPELVHQIQEAWNKSVHSKEQQHSQTSASGPSSQAAAAAGAGEHKEQKKSNSFWKTLAVIVIGLLILFFLVWILYNIVQWLGHLFAPKPFQAVGGNIGALLGGLAAGLAATPLAISQWNKKHPTNGKKKTVTYLRPSQGPPPPTASAPATATTQVQQSTAPPQGFMATMPYTGTGFFCQPAPMMAGNGSSEFYGEPMAATPASS